MTDLLPVAPDNAPEVIAWKTAQRIAQTEFVPEAFRRRPDAIFAAILYGRELGMGPMQAMRAINVIKGKPTLSPETMRSRVFDAGHTIQPLEYTSERVTLRGIRRDGAVAEVTWTMEDAKRARLVKTDKPDSAWMSYPRAMLLARATSELCRLLFPDAIAGASYTPEELGGDNPEPDDSDVIDVVEVEAGDERVSAGTPPIQVQEPVNDPIMVEDASVPGPEKLPL